MSAALSSYTPAMPPRGGVGLKPEHYRTILETRPDIGFLEVHAENYMGQGGPPHRYLSAIAAMYPLSLHGVGLSIGGNRRLDQTHLSRLKETIQRYNPVLFSEHLAWSTHDVGFFHDLLPLPYTASTLQHVCEHIDEVQTTLSRQMLLENPSTYLRFAGSTYSEGEFIAEVAKRTGCGLLLDVNNVFVASTNQGWDPLQYLNGYPISKVQEIHLAGYKQESDERESPLLIDTHDRPVSEVVWSLFEETIRRTGPMATLIEWDADVPSWATLQAEATRAESLMLQVEAEATHNAPTR